MTERGEVGGILACWDKKLGLFFDSKVFGPPAQRMRFLDVRAPRFLLHKTARSLPQL